MNKFSLTELLIPLFVSFFMSGINAALAQVDQYEIRLSIFFLDWGKNWAFAYLCLLIIVPLSKNIVLKLLSNKA